MDPELMENEASRYQATHRKEYSMDAKILNQGFLTSCVNHGGQNMTSGLKKIVPKSFKFGEGKVEKLQDIREDSHEMVASNNPDNFHTQTLGNKLKEESKIRTFTPSAFKQNFLEVPRFRQDDRKND